MLGADCNELIIVYTGNGKGKTTAALGAALRALGHGKKVHIVYFIKGSGPNAEQVAMSKLPDITFSRFGKKGFVDPDNVTPEDREEAQKSFLAAQEAVVSGNYSLIVLDEINVAVAWNLLEVETVINLIDRKPANVDIILTGRYADQKLIARADLVTEMLEIKHPYARGAGAKKGIDY